MSQDNKLYTENQKRILAKIHNPTCLRLHQSPASLFSPTHEKQWNPRLRFLEWAQQPQKFSQAFSSLFPNTNIRCVSQHIVKKEGMYSLKHPISFPFFNEPQCILADAIIMHTGIEKIIVFCCQPDIGGQTNRYALQRARMHAAVCSYAHAPQNPSKTTFLVLHQWKTLTIHEESIEDELEQIQESIAIYQQQPKQEYQLLDSCRWYCPKISQCTEQAQQEGNPIAWSLELHNILASDVWSAKELLQIDAPQNPLKNIAYFYQRAFPEGL